MDLELHFSRNANLKILESAPLILPMKMEATLLFLSTIFRRASSIQKSDKRGRNVGVRLVFERAESEKPKTWLLSDQPQDRKLLAVDGCVNFA